VPAQRKPQAQPINLRPARVNLCPVPVLGTLDSSKDAARAQASCPTKSSGQNASMTYGQLPASSPIYFSEGATCARRASRSLCVLLCLSSSVSLAGACTAAGTLCITHTSTTWGTPVTIAGCPPPGAIMNCTRKSSKSGKCTTGGWLHPSGARCSE